MSEQRKKLAILATHAIQHFVPVYQRLVEDYDIDLKVFYIAENGVKDAKDTGFSTSFSWDIPLLDGYEYEFVNPGLTVNHFGFFEIDAKGISEKINEYNPDFIWINGYWALANWRALLGRKRNQHVIYSSDSNLLDQRSGWRRFIKYAIVKFFITRCQKYISVSEQNKKYLQHYGAQENQIENACYPIDMRRLLKSRDQFSAKDRKELRSRYGLKEDDFVVIFSGKLVDYKRPVDLVNAVAKINQLAKAGEQRVAVMFMGDGPQKNGLKALAKQLGVSEQIAFTGFINQSEISLHLFAADVFALTSSKEPFGAVISEALPFGLPIVAADKIGAVGDTDSAQPDKNALVYPWGEIQLLAEAIMTLKNDPQRYNSYREHSLSLVDKNDTKVYCEALLRCMAGE